VANPPQSDEERRQESAASFFVRMLDDPADVVRAEIEQWLTADHRNAVAFAQVARAWDRAGMLRSVAPSPDHDPHRSPGEPVLPPDHGQQ